MGLRTLSHPRVPSGPSTQVTWWNFHHIIFTARKRSLRRLCFYRCLSVHVGACVVALGGHAWLLRGACMVALGGVHGCSQGGCMVALVGCMVALGGGMVAPEGACMVALGGACMVALGDMHGCSGGACMVVLGECVWDMTRYGDMINERAVRILLECILVVLDSPPTLNTRVKEVVRVFFASPPHGMAKSSIKHVLQH